MTVAGGRLASRLARLERRSGPSWRGWVGRPFGEWPDEALEALICDRTGQALGSLTYEELQQLIEAAKAAAPEAGPEA
jgi:hypothetical protein